MECITALPDHAANFRAAFKKINTGMHLCLQAHVKCNMHSDGGTKQERQSTEGILFVYSSVNSLRALFKPGEKSQPPPMWTNPPFSEVGSRPFRTVYLCLSNICEQCYMKWNIITEFQRHIQQIIWLTTCWLTCSFLKLTPPLLLIWLSLHFGFNYFFLLYSVLKLFGCECVNQRFEWRK